MEGDFLEEGTGRVQDVEEGHVVEAEHLYDLALKVLGLHHGYLLLRVLIQIHHLLSLILFCYVCHA